MSYMYVLLMIQIILILYNISLYRFGLITVTNETERPRYNKMLFLNTNEMDDDWGQFVNIEII